MAKAATGFPPVIDAGVETLILGSFPSVASLGKAQYYGHPQNQFWRLVGAAIGEPLSEMDYETRKRTLLVHCIGLWDVIGACVREGSLDADIREPRHNDFVRVTGVASGLRRIFFNGKSAGKFERQFATWGYDTAVLPSSSPAYTLSYAAKLEQWRRIGAAAGAVTAAGTPARRSTAPVARRASHAPRSKC